MKIRKKGLMGLLATAMLLAGLLVPAAAVAADPGHGEITKPLYAGQDIDVGTVTVWNDATDLHVEYETTDGWVMTETHLEVVCATDDFPTTKKGNPKVGHFTYGEPLDPPNTEWSEVIPLSEVWCGGDPLFIAAQAEVVRPIDDCWETVWQIGDVEVAQMDNPCDEFSYPTILSGEQDFYVGTTPTTSFPWVSVFSTDDAVIVNSHFNAGLPFGGRFLISWSPGATPNMLEIWTASLDASALGSPITRDGAPVVGWFSGWERFIETFDVDPIASGVHTLTTQFTHGDGSVWDWVKLEKPCEQWESAWAGGEGSGRFVPKGNWATHFPYTWWCPDVVGDWEMDLYIGATLYERFVVITSQVDGDIEGFMGLGYDPQGEATGNITGDVDCFDIYMLYDRVGYVETGYTAEFWGSIAADGDSMSGTWSDYARDGESWYMTRL